MTSNRKLMDFLDATYTQLITQLRGQLTVLAGKIAQKVYVYGFLKE